MSGSRDARAVGNAVRQQGCAGSAVLEAARGTRPGAMGLPGCGAGALLLRDNKRRRPRSPAGSGGVSQRRAAAPSLPAAVFLFGVFGVSGCWEEAAGEGRGVGRDSAVPRSPLSVCETHYSERFSRCY